MIEADAQLINSFHLAGIIPIAGQKLDFDFPWDDCLQPIGRNYLAVERAVWECVCAGCETIWIVCHDDTQPLIRYRLGDYVQDPMRHNLLRRTFPIEHERIIPIYYVPIHPRDRDKRDCLGWSILYGALTAYWLSKTISKWVVPSKYYTAFPYGIYNPELLLPLRKKISTKTPFHISYKNMNIKNNEYLGFTFDADDFKQARRIIRKEGTGEFPAYDSPKRIPLEKRWSARFFELDKIFRDVIMGGANVLEVPWYHNISNWNGLRRFLGSEESATFKRPDKTLMGYHEWNPIGIDNEEE